MSLTASAREEVWASCLVFLAVCVVIAILLCEFNLIKRSIPTFLTATNVQQCNIILSQILLFSCFLCTLCSLAHAFNPNIYVCAFTKVFSSMSYTLIFGTLFSKSIVVISLQKEQPVNTIYVGFMIGVIALIQAVINVQYVTALDAVSMCSTVFLEFVKNHSFGYMLLLLLLACCLTNFRNPYNYRESSAMFLCGFMSACIAGAWMSIGILLPIYSQVATAYALYTTSLVIVLVMFVPRNRRLTGSGEGSGLTKQDAAQKDAMKWCVHDVAGAVPKPNNSRSSNGRTTSTTLTVPDLPPLRSENNLLRLQLQRSGQREPTSNANVFRQLTTKATQTFQATLDVGKPRFRDPVYKL